MQFEKGSEEYNDITEEISGYSSNFSELIKMNESISGEIKYTYAICAKQMENIVKRLKSFEPKSESKELNNLKKDISSYVDKQKKKYEDSKGAFEKIQKFCRRNSGAGKRGSVEQQTADLAVAEIKQKLAEGKKTVKAT